jgi:hypothetical protein
MAAVFDTSAVAIKTITGLDDNLTGVPDRFVLFQNYPNPFNPRTTIRYGLPERSKVIIKIYDITGTQVQILENSMKDAGYHNISWNSSRVASGIYFYQVQTENFAAVKKCLYIK